MHENSVYQVSFLIHHALAVSKLDRVSDYLPSGPPSIWSVCFTMSTVAKLDSVSKHLPSELPSIWSVYFTTSTISKLDRVTEYLPSRLPPTWYVYFTMSELCLKWSVYQNIYQTDLTGLGQMNEKWYICPS